MIFEDDEKDNIEIDLSINSDDTDGISWDDLLDESQAEPENKEKADENSELQQIASEEIKTEEPIELNLTGEVQDETGAVNLVDGLEGIEVENSNDTITDDDDLESFVNLDLLEDQNNAPVIDESSAQIPQGDVFEVENTANEHTEIEYNPISEGENENGSNNVNKNVFEQDVNPGAADMEPQEVNSEPSNDRDTSDIIGIASLNSDFKEDINEDIFNLENQDNPKGSGKDTKTPIIMGIITAVALVAAIVLTFVLLNGSGGTIFSRGNDDLDSIEITEDVNIDDALMSLGSEDVPQAGEGLVQGEVQNKPQANNEQKNQPSPEEKVVINIVKTGRSNPFSPTGNVSEAGYTIPSLNNLAPPSDLAEDEELGKLVDIVCTGILYDNIKPSAIVTVGGVDYFVQKGDRVDKFIVAAITPTSVVIRNGSNSYVATIGQAFDIQGEPGKMNYVYNKKSKTVTRQYLSPQEIEVKVKED